jgi:hypothetical protein
MINPTKVGAGTSSCEQWITESNEITYFVSAAAVSREASYGCRQELLYVPVSRKNHVAH